MADNCEIMILASVLIIVLLATYKAVKAAFNFGRAGTFAMSVCVSLLSVIGMSRCLKGSLSVILLPYAALAVAILGLLLLSIIAKCFRGPAERSSEHPKENRRSESQPTKQHSRNIQKS